MLFGGCIGIAVSRRPLRPTIRNCMKVFRATLTALLMLVGVAWVGSAQVDADPVDMRVWVGKYPIKMYPTDVVGGWTFLESPKVKTRIAVISLANKHTSWLTVRNRYPLHLQLGR
jgi:anaerobic C4-dicarboxylate transporter